jgi:hypothetical protein
VPSRHLNVARPPTSVDPYTLLNGNPVLFFQNFNTDGETMAPAQ